MTTTATQWTTTKTNVAEMWAYTTKTPTLFNFVASPTAPYLYDNLSIPYDSNLDAYDNLSYAPASYAITPKNSDAWGHITASQTYPFDDRFTFDSNLTDFDYLINRNTDNQRGQTAWKDNT